MVRTLAPPPPFPLSMEMTPPPPSQPTPTPPSQPQSDGSHHPSAGREDWWSEDATATLIEAWGDRYVKLNRGNLRQSDWKEVTEAVNSRHGSGKPKSDVQCKNRIDTLKKKYKTEKGKSSSSSWRFFPRLDTLIGPVLKKSSASAGAGGGAVKSAPVNPNLNPTGSKSTGSFLNDDDDDDDDEDDDETGDWGFVARKQHRVEDVDPSEGSTCRELAKAILKFREAYERIEGVKQQMIIELEKQRMEITKELELQRMNMLMEMQLEFEKSKHRKHETGSDTICPGAKAYLVLSCFGFVVNVFGGVEMDGVRSMSYFQTLLYLCRFYRMNSCSI